MPPDRSGRGRASPSALPEAEPRLTFRCSSPRRPGPPRMPDPRPHRRYSHQPVDILGIRLQQVSICNKQTHRLRAQDRSRAAALHPAPPPAPSPPALAPGLSTPTQVGEQQCPQGALVCLVRHLWRLGSLMGRERGSRHPHQGQTSCDKQRFLEKEGKDVSAHRAGRGKSQQLPPLE